MIANIERVADYFASLDMALVDAHVIDISPGSAQLNTTTAPDGFGIVIPLAGRARFTLDGTPYLLTPGTVVHATPGTRLNKEVIGNRTWSYALVHYEIAGRARGEWPESGNFSIPIGESPRMFDLSRQLGASAVATGSMAVLRARALFQALIEEILLSATRRRESGRDGRIDDILAYLHGNYASLFTIAELAKRFGMSAKSFGAVFQRHTGMTPVGYLTELRINRSKELLRTCACPVSRVAECVGYHDPFYFSRLFKKVIGASPTEFRTTGEIAHDKAETGGFSGAAPHTVDL